MAKSATQSATREIEDLAGEDIETLRSRWTELFAIAPLARISREMLIRGIAHRLQEEVYSALGKSTLRRLRQLAKELDEGGALASAQSPGFKSGTRLIREWQGKIHEVVIAGDTYIWGGQHYRSLSQIAREITGTRWSGPRFFGLERGNAVVAPASLDAPPGVKVAAGTAGKISQRPSSRDRLAQLRSSASAGDYG